MTQEQKAAREEDRKQDRAERNRHKRAVDKAEAQLKKVAESLETEGGTSAEKMETVLNAVAELARVSKEAGSKPEGKRARQVLKDANIGQDEIDRATSKLRSTRTITEEDISEAQTAPPEDKPNEAFSKATNAAQALGVIAKTGNLFQVTLANRLRAFVAGVKFVVIEAGQELPEGLQSKKMQESWEKARGMFVFRPATGERVVYVRGASFGEDNGINNTIVLHEMLHAALNQKLNLALEAIKGNYSLNSPLVREYNELIRIMNSAGKRWNELAREGKLPPRIAGMARSANIFGDPREFVAYGMSDPEFQEFLRSARGEEAETSYFNRFVNNIRKFFGMDEDDVNALSDLVVVTDKLLSSRKTAEMRIVERGQKREAQMRQANREEASNAAKKNGKKISATERKIQRSDEFQDIVDGMDDLTKLRDPNVFLDVMSAGWKSLNIKKLEAILPAIPTNVLAEWGERLGINHMKSAYQMTQDMDAMRMKMLSAASDIAKDWSALQQGVIKRGVSRLRGMKKSDELRALANAMHYATDKRVDPTKTRSDPVMNKMWDALSPKAQEIFVRTRDHYRAMYDLYRALLEDRLKLLKVPGKDNDPNTPRGHLMAEIKKIYEAGLKFEPYFPLMRYGDYWLRVGQGKSGEFYMFENPMQRELFLKQRIRKLQAEGDTRTEKEMRADEFIESGNSLRGLREKSAETSTLLKNVLNAIGSAQYGLTAEEVEDLKDQVYQLYLTTMPDDSFRAQFIHRKGKAGFSGDALRNFATSSVNMANQLSRVKYGPRMLMEVDMAKESLKGNPDAEKLRMLVDEMGIRAGMQANPPLYNPLARGVANFANKSAFLYLMTSVKTALVQFASLPVFGTPVLLSRHDPAKVVKEMGRFMLVFNSVGVVDKDKDGILQWRVGDISLGNSRRVALDPEEQRAFEEMQERGIAEVTMTYDLMDRRATPSAKYVGAFNTATNAMGALFHHVERLNREIMFMTSFRLSMQEGMTFDEAIDQAVADTYDALGNFSEANRPRVMRGPVGKTLLQFKTFPAFVTTYLVRNFYRMIKPMDKQDRKEAVIQFFGTVGMSTALAGYVGIPGAAFMMGVLEGLISAFRDDEDEDPLEKKDLELWLRRVFIREVFGETKVGDVPLSEVLDSGMIDTMTGLKISDSMSMNNMWFPELKEQATAQAAVSDYLLGMLGPAASIFTKRLPGAIDDFSNGRILQGFEKALPALFSNPIKAYRFSKEGALTQTGAEIKGADEFTAGQIAAQALGFRTKGLAEKQEDNFKVEAIRVKVLQEKQKLTNRLDRELELGSDEGFQKALDELVKYGWRYPSMAMKADEIQKLFERRAKARGMSDRGFRVDKKLYPHLAELLEASTETLEREAKKD